MVVDDTGNSYTCGSFYNTIDFDPGLGEYQGIAVAQGRVFNLKLNSTLSIEEIADLKPYTLFPNPVSHYLHIHSEFDETESIEVYTLVGTKVLFTSSSDLIDLSSFPSGPYIIIRNNTKGKLIIKK